MKRGTVTQGSPALRANPGLSDGIPLGFPWGWGAGLRSKAANGNDIDVMRATRRVVVTVAGGWVPPLQGGDVCGVADPGRCPWAGG